MNLLIRTFSKTVLYLIAISMTVSLVAHSNSKSLLEIKAQSDTTLSLRIESDLLDWQQVINLDIDANGEVTWEELNFNSAAVSSYVQSRLLIKNGTDACTILPANKFSGIRNREAAIFSVIDFTAECETQLTEVAINAQLFQEIDPDHRVILNTDATKTGTLTVLQAGYNNIYLSHSSNLAAFTSFSLEGVRHIFKGYDHLAFLLLLLLPLTRMRVIRDQFLKAAGIVTAFTLAHTITLTMASSGQLNLPAGPVELVIALSVVLAAILNIIEPKQGAGWIIAFAFGLVHGFGFAGALAELTGSQGNHLISLIGFNVGVEFGQLLVVCLVFPVLLYLSRKRYFSKAMVPVLSLLVAVLGATWAIERAAFIY